MSRIAGDVLATFQPDGEQREAIALALAEKWPGDYMQGDDECEREPNALAYETADTAILAGWRDRGTIPMDGTNVLIAEDHRGSSGEAYYDAEEGRWYWANTGRGDYPTPDEPSPTHWQPLPAPPIRSARDGGAET